MCVLMHICAFYVFIITADAFQLAPSLRQSGFRIKRSMRGFLEFFYPKSDSTWELGSCSCSSSGLLKLHPLEISLILSAKSRSAVL